LIFKYSKLGQDGKSTSAKIEAVDIEEAKAKLKSQGVMYKKLKEDNFTFLNRVSFRKNYKITLDELAWFSRDISMYLKSGISLVNAVNLSLNQYINNKKMTLFLQSIKTLLDEGKNFYFALENQNVISLPNFYKQSIKVSEDSGILDEVLQELSRFLKEQSRIEKQIQNAFTYPFFMLVISAFMLGFMVAYVVPKISLMFEQMNQELPKITKFVISAGDWLSNYWIYAILSIIFSVISIKIVLKLSKKAKYIFDYLMLKIPFFGKIIETSELARFTYVSSMLIKSGVPFVKAVRLSSAILKNSVISNIFEKASLKVVEGSRLSFALQKSEYELNTSFIQAITLGEETSEVSNVLKNISELYFEENKDRITFFLSLLDPILMLVVGGIIGFIITSMLLPIFSMNIA